MPLHAQEPRLLALLAPIGDARPDDDRLRVPPIHGRPEDAHQRDAVLTQLAHRLLAGPRAAPGGQQRLQRRAVLRGQRREEAPDGFLRRARLRGRGRARERGHQRHTHARPSPLRAADRHRSVAVRREQLVVARGRELVIAVRARQGVAVAHAAVVVGGVQRVLGVTAAAAAAAAEAVADDLRAVPVVRLAAHPRAAAHVVLVAAAREVVAELGNLLVVAVLEAALVAVVLRVRVPVVVPAAAARVGAIAARVAAQHGVAAALLAHHRALQLHGGGVLRPQAHRAPKVHGLRGRRVTSGQLRVQRAVQRGEQLAVRVTQLRVRGALVREAIHRGHAAGRVHQAGERHPAQPHLQPVHTRLHLARGERDLAAALGEGAARLRRQRQPVLLRLGRLAPIRTTTAPQHPRRDRGTQRLAHIVAFPPARGLAPRETSVVPGTRDTLKAGRVTRG
ncbi:hypothetical protein HPC49_39055 [Pyxidicoccus fallax]|uniref:Uncharacterized protein n=1 Tax=Pyxidicoccus fallax TaxID=394095 RepID=A0A848LC26_9BACT|nr:hypothetical protein [Pyxidicoccus fallax]NPC84199.1 hypothetical protein [Pyxidicoccus fallax]